MMAGIRELLEEQLREAACFGNLELISELICKNVDVNSKNTVNKWTALHWAAYRNNLSAVTLLLKNGADKLSLTNKEETPAQLSTNPEIVKLLGENFKYTEHPKLPIVPNYLKNPPILVSSKNQTAPTNQYVDDEFVLKIRTEGEIDFIEVDFTKSHLTYEKLKKSCCEELLISEKKFKYIRKLPNTRLRNDKDVQRLNNYQELEIVLFTD